MLRLKSMVLKYHEYGVHYVRDKRWLDIRENRSFEDAKDPQMVFSHIILGFNNKRKRYVLIWLARELMKCLPAEVVEAILYYYVRDEGWKVQKTQDRLHAQNSVHITPCDEIRVPMRRSGPQTGYIAGPSAVFRREQRWVMDCTTWKLLPPSSPPYSVSKHDRSSYGPVRTTDLARYVKTKNLEKYWITRQWLRPTRMGHGQRRYSETILRIKTVGSGRIGWIKGDRGGWRPWGTGEKSVIHSYWNRRGGEWKPWLGVAHPPRAAGWRGIVWPQPD